MKFDMDKVAHDLALAYAESELGRKEFATPQEKLDFILEEYCAALGYFTSRNDEYIKALIHRGE